jgi:hypothetical protein
MCDSVIGLCLMYIYPSLNMILKYRPLLLLLGYLRLVLISKRFCGTHWSQSYWYISLYLLLALNHLLAHCPCELNSGSNIFKKFAKLQGDPIEYDYKIQYYLSSVVDR